MTETEKLLKRITELEAIGERHREMERTLRESEDPPQKYVTELVRRHLLLSRRDVSAMQTPMPPPMPGRTDRQKIEQRHPSR